MTLTFRYMTPSLQDSTSTQFAVLWQITCGSASGGKSRIFTYFRWVFRLMRQRFT